MKNNFRKLIKTVIEENSVAFKDQTAKVLYGKIGMRLQEQYKLVAKNIISKVLHEEEDSNEKEKFENSTKSSDVIVKGKTTSQREHENSTMNPSGNKTPKAKTLAQRRQETENSAMNPSDNLRPKPEASDAQRRINNNQ